MTKPSIIFFFSYLSLGTFLRPKAPHIRGHVQQFTFLSLKTLSITLSMTFFPSIPVRKFKVHMKLCAELGTWQGFRARPGMTHLIFAHSRYHSLLELSHSSLELSRAAAVGAAKCPAGKKGKQTLVAHQYLYYPTRWSEPGRQGMLNPVTAKDLCSVQYLIHGRVLVNISHRMGSKHLMNNKERTGPRIKFKDCNFRGKT